MLVVIRCPNCRGASRVEEGDLGQMVECPACADTFTAIEEAELVAPTPRSLAGAETADRPSARGPVKEAEPPAEPPPALAEEGKKPEPPADLDAQLDPYGESPGSLPATVLIGLALLPFLIPILWVIAPAAIGVEPVLSLGSALALAVSASVMCLAVIYTVDWQPSTRIRGVLLLVILSYITGIGLYLMKKEWVDRLRKFFGINPTWTLFQPPQAGYEARLPGHPREFPRNAAQPLSLANLALWQASQTSVGIRGEDIFTVGSGEARPRAGGKRPPPGSDAWFDAVVDDIVDRSGGRLVKPARKVTNPDVGGTIPGREIVIDLQAAGTVRVVRVFFLSWTDPGGAVKNRIYYAAIEGPNMSEDDKSAMHFFDEFIITDPPN